MKAPVVLIGMGEMGAVFARGMLKLGHPVYPVTRDMDMHQLATSLPAAPEAVICAVGEADIHQVISEIPEQWHASLLLLQNELLPRDWQSLSSQPTVISVWFEKKKGMDSKVIIPSPVFGPLSKLVTDALATLDIPTKQLTSEAELLSELVVKNLYILTSNIAGLEVGGNVGELWENHQDVANAVIDDVLLIQQKLTGQPLDKDELVKLMLVAFEGDPQHQCMGRSAPARLQRALQQAAEFGLSLNKLPQIHV